MLNRDSRVFRHLAFFALDAAYLAALSSGRPLQRFREMILEAGGYVDAGQLQRAARRVRKAAGATRVNSVRLAALSAAGVLEAQTVADARDECAFAVRFALESWPGKGR